MAFIGFFHKPYGHYKTVPSCSWCELPVLSILLAIFAKLIWLYVVLLPIFGFCTYYWSCKWNYVCNRVFFLFSAKFSRVSLKWHWYLVPWFHQSDSDLTPPQFWVSASLPLRTDFLTCFLFNEMRLWLLLAFFCELLLPLLDVPSCSWYELLACQLY